MCKCNDNKANMKCNQTPPLFVHPFVFKVVANAGPTGFFRTSSDLVVGGQRESFWRLETSSTCIGFEEVCASGEGRPRRSRDPVLEEERRKW